MDFEDEDNLITITMRPNDHDKVKDVLENMISDIDYEVDQIGMFPKDKVTLSEENLELFKKLYTMLDNIDDVTEIYHNVDIDL